MTSAGSVSVMLQTAAPVERWNVRNMYLISHSVDSKRLENLLDIEQVKYEIKKYIQSNNK
jgi:hypothetical protein